MSSPRRSMKKAKPIPADRSRPYSSSTRRSGRSSESSGSRASSKLTSARPIYPKRTAQIDKLIVDIGDKVKKGDVLATLFVPELVLEDYRAKNAAVELDQARVELARKTAKVSEADVLAAKAHLAEARAILAKDQAEVERRDAEVKRLNDEVATGVTAAQVLIESRDRLKSSTAARDAAVAAIEKTEAELLAKEAALAKAQVDIKVAEAALAVAQSEQNRLKASVGSLTLIAPYDGVIVARNAKPGELAGPPRVPRRST